MPYTLLEYKLRRYLYLGEEYSMYMSIGLKNKFDFDVTGVNVIGKIVKKKNMDDINSIVEIILKVKKENNVVDEKFLIFALAVCAKFNLNYCKQMVTDAYAAIQSICTDGMKLMMFVKFCEIATNLLYKQKYTLTENKGFGRGLQKAMQKWYTTKDPYETTKMLVRYKHYRNITHKDIMLKCHIHSDEPVRKIYICFIKCGLKHVLKKYSFILDKKKKKMSFIENCLQQQMKYVYNYLLLLDDIPKMNETNLKHEILRNMLGYEFQIIPQVFLTNIKVLNSIIAHMPLNTLLGKTFFLAKNGFFYNIMQYDGCYKFISRFNESCNMKKLRIHPHEAFLEYLRYTKYGLIISDIIKIKSKKITDTNDLLNEITYDAKNEILPLNINDKHSEEKVSTLRENVFSKQRLYFMKPPPQRAAPLMKFLSEDLMKITLDLIKPYNRRMLIIYDKHAKVRNKNCSYMHVRFLKVYEAITMIVLSLIYPESEYNKPNIWSMSDTKKLCKEIKIDYEQPLTYKNLEKTLFKEVTTTKVVQTNDSTKNWVRRENPFFIVNWALEKKIEYDVIVILGTNTMTFYELMEIKREYQETFNKKLRFIICCLNGKHSDQKKFSRNGILFIMGFDKNVGKLIESFLNEEI